MLIQNIHFNQLGKNVFTTLAFLLLTVITSFGQGVPQAFKYQAVIRDAQGEVVPDTPVEMQMSILVQGPNANYPNIIYQETHDAVTNRFGLVSLEVGNGEVIFGDFPTIDWAAADHFLGVEVSINGGPFIDLGSTQLLSVPYALLAQKAVEGDDDDDPENELQKLIQTGNEVELTLDGGTITVADDDNDPVNEIQTLSQNGNDVTLSNNGGTISVADNDNDSSNELQDWNNLPGIPGDIADGDDVDDADADPANELQTLSQSGNDVTLSNNGGTISVADNDNDSSNELQDWGNLPGIPGDIADGDDVDDADADPNNELQDWSNLPGIPGDLLDGDDTDDADADPSNEIQTLSLNGSDLTISGGNTIVLPDNGSDLPENPASGTMVYYDGTEWMPVPPGQHDQTLSFCHGAPYWGTCPELPEVTTKDVANVRAESARVGGNVASSEGTPLLARGICWSTSPNPTLNDNVITAGASLGNFTKTMTGLTLGTTYYVKAYATNALGTTYGAQKSFTAAYGYGDELGGGIIFYISGANEDRNNDGFFDQYMIAALDDEPDTYEWGCPNTNVGGVFNLSNLGCSPAFSHEGYGYTNNWILSDCNEDDKAAKVCFEKSENVNGDIYDDWYLPSQFELKEMYHNLHQNGYGGFVGAFYWSSNESRIYIHGASEDFRTKAVGINFSSNANCVHKLKTTPSRVRAVRVYPNAYGE